MPLHVFSVYMKANISISYGTIAETLARRGLRGDLTNTWKYIKDGSQVNAAGLFSVLPSNKTKGNGHKLQLRKFSMSMTKESFTLKVTEHLNVFLCNLL